MERAIKHTDKWGGEHVLELSASRRPSDGSLAIAAWVRDEDCILEPYDEITEHLGMGYRDSTAHICTDRFADIRDELIRRGWAKQIRVDVVDSCEFALLEFTDEFIDSFCPGVCKVGSGL